MIFQEKGKRLGIFFFYDKDGVVDRYIDYMLQNIVPFFEKLLVVCNGQLKQAGRELFRKYSSDIIVRENTGLDVGAYKEAMGYIGWEQLAAYDETVIFNHTIMGPVYPFAEMFASMDGRDVDFWGITKYGREEFDPFGYSEYTYLPEHIQSHFMAFRKTLLSSPDFRLFWEGLPVIKSYAESIGLFESAFTKKFGDKGYKWEVYIDTDEYEGITTYPLMNYPRELVENKRCPVFKRRTFFQPYDYVLSNTMGQSAEELMRFLQASGLYDVDMIWENILRTCNQADFVKNLQLQYILSTEMTPIEKIAAALLKNRVALVMHLYFEDLIDSSYAYAEMMPENTDVYVTTNTEEKKKKIEEKFSRLNSGKLEVRLIENRGRDVSSLLVGVKDVIMEYDIVCFVHDKKTAQVNPGSVGEGFAYKCFMNTLYNKEFVCNVIDCFDKNPRLGLLSPPVPNHGDFFPTLGGEWSVNFENVQKLAKKLNINVPMEKGKEPIAPLGTFFWFRPAALKPLFEYNWEYKDFPPEPNGTDGTLLHAVERLYPFAVQQAGYYPAVLLSDRLAAMELNNLEYYVREYNRVLLDKGLGGLQYSMVERLKDALAYLKPSATEDLEAAFVPREFYENMHQEWKNAVEALNGVNQAYQTVINSLSWKIVSRINRVIDRLAFWRKP